MFNSAASSLKEIASQAPQNALYQYHYGMSLWKLARNDEAKKALQRAIQLSVPGPEAAEATRVLASLPADPQANAHSVPLSVKN